MSNYQFLESMKDAWTDAELKLLTKCFLQLLIENKELKAEIVRLSEAGNPASFETGNPVSGKVNHD